MKSLLRRQIERKAYVASDNLERAMEETERLACDFDLLAKDDESRAEDYARHAIDLRSCYAELAEAEIKIRKLLTCIQTSVLTKDD